MEIKAKVAWVQKHEKLMKDVSEDSLRCSLKKMSGGRLHYYSCIREEDNIVGAWNKKQAKNMKV